MGLSRYSLREVPVRDDPASERRRELMVTAEDRDVEKGQTGLDYLRSIFGCSGSEPSAALYGQCERKGLSIHSSIECYIEKLLEENSEV